MRPFVLAALGTLACSSPPPEPPPESALAPSGCAPGAATRAAVARAESFVRAQGYTDAPAQDVALVLQWPEEETTERTTILDQRHGELLPHAVGVFANEGDGPLAVVFEYRSRRDGTRVGRALLDTDPPRFVHQDALVDHAIPLCPP